MDARRDWEAMVLLGCSVFATAGCGDGKGDSASDAGAIRITGCDSFEFKDPSSGATQRVELVGDVGGVERDDWTYFSVTRTNGCISQVSVEKYTFRGQVSAEDDSAALTDVRGDRLFRLTLESAPVAYPLATVRLFVRASGTTDPWYTALSGPSPVGANVEDTNGNGSLDPGEALIGIEQPGMNLTAADIGTQFIARLTTDDASSDIGRATWVAKN